MRLVIAEKSANASELRIAVVVAHGIDNRSASPLLQQARFQKRRRSVKPSL